MSDETLQSPEAVKQELKEIILSLAERTSALKEKLEGKPTLEQALRDSLIDGLDVRSDGNPAHLRVVGKSIIAVEGIWEASNEGFLQEGTTPAERVRAFLDRDVISGERVTQEDKKLAIEHLKNFSQLLDELGL